MQITHVGHSCVLVEAGGARLLFDPGTFTQGWEALRDLDAVLVTHEHRDHLDRDRLPALLAGNPGARLVVEPGLAEQLDGQVERDVEPFAVGAQTRVGELEVTGVGGRHAVIHADIPRIGNVGFVVGEPSGPRLFHPGDMIDTVPDGIDVLAVPLSAPWSAVKETVEFVRGVAAPVAFGIHDAILSGTGRGLYQRVLGSLTPSTEVRDLPEGATATF